MSTRETPWPQGTPCWVDLSSTDREAAWAFYTTLFGWQITDVGEQFGHYGLAAYKGFGVAGLGSKMPDDPTPPTWTTYLACDDIEATVAAIAAHGGKLVSPTMAVGAMGSMAIAVDPAGAMFGVWQADDYVGSAIVNEPNTVVWNENLTRDAEANRAFYAAVFGYTYTTMAGEQDYTTIDGAGPGNTVGGLGALSADLPAEVPPHWMTHFQVEDADAFCEAVMAGGGVVRMGPSDNPYGRGAVIADPQGAVFSIMSMTAAS